jgi:hypothetical protein
VKVWPVLQIIVALWLLRKLLHLIPRLVSVAVMAVAWPVTLVGALGFGAAWLRGWPAARLYRAAVWSMPMTLVYVVAAALQARTWQALALTPVVSWEQATRLLEHARIAEAVLLTVPWAVPAGLAAGGTAWARHCWAVTTGLSGGSAFAAAAFDMRQWRRQTATARGALASPGAVPLATRDGTAVPAGPVIRAVSTRWHPVLAVPAFLFMRHMVIVGASGSGKTNLMIRLWGGWYACALEASRRGKPRPLLCALDCKGGPDARAKADRTRKVLRGTGARRVAV